MQTKLHDKIYGALMGFACGDAFGVPVEEMHHASIQKLYGTFYEMLPVKPRLLGGHPRYEQSVTAATVAAMETGRTADPFGSHAILPGSYSDDTRYMLLCARAIVQYGRRITALEFAQFLSEYVQDLQATRAESDLERQWATAMFHFEALHRIGCDRHHFSSLFEICTGWDGVGGLINPFDPYEAALDGGPMAAGVARALAPDATVDAVVGAVRDAYWSLPGRFCDAGVDFLQNSYVKRMDAILDFAARSGDPEAVIHELYDKYLVTFPPYNFVFPLEMIPAACAILKACKGDYTQTVAFCAQFGRDCDGTAAMGGQLAATIAGGQSIPATFVAAVNAANPLNIGEISEALYQVAFAQLRATEQRAESFRRLTQ